MGRVEGKVAFITGAARGQGRSHAIRLAQEGADIIAVDLCESVASTPYAGATDADLAETVMEVEKLDRRIVAIKADVRDFAALSAALDQGVAQLGSLDIVIANAGITSFGSVDQLSEQSWQDMMDINLTGVWLTVKAAIPHLRAGGAGGSIVLISSGAGLRGYMGLPHYVTSKHGLVGLMRSCALELAPERIRVNSIHPTNVDTPMLQHETMYRKFLPDVDQPTVEQFASVAQTRNALPVPWVESIDVSNAILFLVSDEGRYITGVTLPVDAGLGIK